MVEDLRYVIYSKMLPHTRALCAGSVDAIQALLIPGVKYLILNEGWLRFETLTSCHTGF